MEKGKLTIGDFKMEGRGSTGKASLKTIEQVTREGTVKAVACDSVSSVCSCSNWSEQPAFLFGDGDLVARVRLRLRVRVRLRIQGGGIFDKIHYGRVELDSADMEMMRGASEPETGPHPDEA